VLTNEEFALLYYMDAYKVVKEANLEADIGLDPKVLQNLCEKGFTKRIKATDLQIEPAGEQAVTEHRQLLLDKSGRKEDLLRYCSQFEEVNLKYKGLVARWQMKDGKVPNDHSDREYDLAIMKELTGVHGEVKNLISNISRVIPTYQVYLRRFDIALQQINEGNMKSMAMARDSYHNVWFELHESLLKLSGKQRVE
jgi:hypothetical protein